jgi:predicted N-formylglutamate amidohydrolase
MPEFSGTPAFLVSCEHGGNQVPPPFAGLFRGHEDLLESHRGYDIGILPLAERLAATFAAPLEARVTRLLVDLNRSPGSRTLFSEISRPLPPSERAAILRDYYAPYRQRVAERVTELLTTGSPVLHLSVHSFTPVFAGRERSTELGLLYDPSSRGELVFCRRWRDAFKGLDPSLRVHCNAPYRGTSDSLVKSLRRDFGIDRYFGIELEVNQKFPLGPPRVWQALQVLVERSLRTLLG